MKLLPEYIGVPGLKIPKISIPQIRSGEFFKRRAQSVGGISRQLKDLSVKPLSAIASYAANQAVRYGTFHYTLGMDAEDILIAKKFKGLEGRKRLMDLFLDFFSTKLPEIKPISFKTSDNQDLVYLHAAHKHFYKNRPTKIFVHGRFGSLISLAGSAIREFNRGYNIAILSYRGHSANGGKPNFKEVVSDISENIDDLQERFALDPKYMQFKAHSLGCAILLDALSQRPNDEIYGEVKLYAPFFRLKDMIIDSTQEFSWGIPSLAKGASAFFQHFDNGAVLSKSLAKRIPNIDLIYSTNDQFIPRQQSYLLYQALKSTGFNVRREKRNEKDHFTIMNEIEELNWEFKKFLRLSRILPGLVN